MLSASGRRPHATPSPRLIIGRARKRLAERTVRARSQLAPATLRLILGAPGAALHFMRTRGIRYMANVAVAGLVVSVPYAFTAPAEAPRAAALPRAAEPVVQDDLATLPTPAPRAQQVGRGTISAERVLMTTLADDVRPIVEHTVAGGETLSALSKQFGVSAEAIAYANDITRYDEMKTGMTLVIPPGEGALYTVKEGDTVESVAEHFKVDPHVIREYQRLYFEPQYFAPGQLIFVPGATVPALVYVSAPAAPVWRPSVGLQGPRSAVPAQRTGALGWPVPGVITQYFWSAHTGVDIAAPYGTGIGASEAGVVTATGWVPVGGLRVCVAHAGGLETCYYHTGAVFVTPGQSVARGQIIASIGMTGVTTGPHVHWEAKLNGRFVNPLAQ